MALELSDDVSIPPRSVDVDVASLESRKLNNIEVIDVDEALGKTGCGRFQWLSYLLITYALLAFGHQMVLQYFIANDPPWTCVRNDTSTFCRTHFGKKIGTENKLFSSRCSLKRDEWTYTTDIHYSIVTEYDLVCGKTAIAALASSIFHVGGAIGMFTSGLAADYFGRKYVLIVLLSIMTMSSIACSFVTAMWQLMILRVCLGAGQISSYSISYVYLSEIVPPKYRTMTGIGYCMGYVSSELILDGVAYFVRKWRYLQLYSSLPCLIAIALVFLLPESARWLMVNKKETEAESTLKKIAKINGKRLHPFSLRSSDKSAEEEDSYTYKHLFTNRKIAVLTLLLAFFWTTIAMAYYTVAFESSNLGGDIYETFGYTTAAEIPSKFVAYFICRSHGRKRPALVTLVLTGSFATATIVIPNASPLKYTFNVVFMMIARFNADICFQALYMWTFELFPTVLRMQGVGICMVFERIGSFVAPFLTSVLHPINPVLPYVIIIVFAVVASASCWVVLPETHNKPTRERYEDFFEKSFEKSAPVNPTSKEKEAENTKIIL